MEAGPRGRPQPDHGRGDAVADAPHVPALDDGLLGAGLADDLIDPLLDDGLVADPDGDGTIGAVEEEQSFRELRPRGLLRMWQVAPIVALAICGSLMFAFPLAFEFGDSGAVVAMLGFLLCCCSAGWGLMAARRAGYTWPGLPPRGSGRRPDWRFVALYAAVAALLVVLAVYRVARLR